jgi:hypothetical protein
MTEESLKKMIVDHVVGVQGCKATELAAVSEIAVACRTLGVSFNRVISDLVDEGNLIEIEYSVPNLPDRIKSFFLPSGSVLYGLLHKEGKQ